MTTLNKNSVSLAGEFAVLSQLALRGYDANLTLGNTKGVDILVSDPKSGKMFRVEVKTSFASKPSHSKLFGHIFTWIMGEKHETTIDPNLFYCFVNIEKEAKSFRFFLVPSKLVAEHVRDSHQYWLKQGEVTDNTIRVFRIGLDDSDYTVFTPSASKYENNWDFQQ